MSSSDVRCFNDFCFSSVKHLQQCERQFIDSTHIHKKRIEEKKVMIRAIVTSVSTIIRTRETVHQCHQEMSNCKAPASREIGVNAEPRKQRKSNWGKKILAIRNTILH